MQFSIKAFQRDHLSFYAATCESEKSKRQKKLCNKTVNFLLLPPLPTSMTPAATAKTLIQNLTKLDDDKRHILNSKHCARCLR